MTYFSLLPIDIWLNESHIKIELINKKNEIFLSKSLSHYLVQCKTNIKDYNNDWDSMKRITNPYEYIPFNSSSFRLKSSHLLYSFVIDSII